MKCGSSRERANRGARVLLAGDPGNLSGIEPGDVVAVEKPGYLPAKELFKELGARVVGVPVDSEGLIVEALPAEADIPLRYRATTSRYLRMTTITRTR